MQRQTQSESLTRRRRRVKRSTNEQRATWLVLLWAVAATVFSICNVPFAIWGSFSLQEKISAVCFLLHGPLCFLGGLAILLRRRALVGWLLTASAACLGSVVVWFVVWAVAHSEDKGVDLTANLIYAAGFFFVSITVYYLARWLGRQEDRQD